MRCLIAEDHEDTREYLKIELEQRGWEVFTAKDGRDALRVYHNAIEFNEFFDLILWDIRMPRMEGLAAGMNIRNFETFAEGIPSACHIYLTGQEDPARPDDLLDSQWLGRKFADGYVRKPVLDIDRLLTEINNNLSPDMEGERFGESSE